MVNEHATLPHYMTADEVAERLRCQPDHVYRLAARGDIPSVKFGGRRLFDPQTIREYLEGTTTSNVTPIRRAN